MPWCVLRGLSVIVTAIALSSHKCPRPFKIRPPQLPAESGEKGLTGRARGSIIGGGPGGGLTEISLYADQCERHGDVAHQERRALWLLRTVPPGILSD